MGAGGSTEVTLAAAYQRDTLPSPRETFQISAYYLDGESLPYGLGASEVEFQIKPFSKQSNRSLMDKIKEH